MPGWLKHINGVSHILTDPSPFKTLSVFFIHSFFFFSSFVLEFLFSSFFLFSQFGLLPSGTNYEIFAESGIAGTDTDLFLNGFTYHTALDGLDDYNPGTLQAIGENSLGLLMEIMASPEQLLASREDASKEEVVKTTFFDIMGLVFVTYDRTIAKVLAITETFVFLFVSGAGSVYLARK